MVDEPPSSNRRTEWIVGGICVGLSLVILIAGVIAGSYNSRSGVSNVSSQRVYERTDGRSRYDDRKRDPLSRWDRKEDEYDKYGVRKKVGEKDKYVRFR
ncbi:MAG: hypothetical protein KKF56_00215 [Nanoarchaeota archaeon]|nr:hypothetical protein [Nanoarchaeota archaeon]